MRDSREGSMQGRSWAVPQSLEPIVRRVLRLGAGGHPLGPRIFAEVVLLQSGQPELKDATSDETGLVTAIARRLSEQLCVGDRRRPRRSQHDVETIRVVPSA